ncbi:MAG: RsmD family RNA methyltransferase [Chloroflexi bacterium]|nr:RsmD family RNA methyltransferase [Chloroflexota bacterium]
MRSALFSIIGAKVEGATVLDLFAGTGALGLEALSRGASRADFVESDARLCSALQARLQDSGYRDQARVFHSRVEKALGLLSGPYDLVLLDPPYDYPAAPVLERLARSTLLAPVGWVVLEHSSRTEPEQSFNKLVLAKRRRHGDTSLSIYAEDAILW